MTSVHLPGTGTNEKAPLPESARGLCWGGFLLSWVWALFNRTWIGLLGLVPVLGFFVQVLLLIKGPSGLGPTMIGKVLSISIECSVGGVSPVSFLSC